MSQKVPAKDLGYDEYSHGPVYRFFRGYFTHFLKLMGANALFLVFNIPSMLIAFAFCLVFLPNYNSIFIPENFVNFVSDLGIIGNEVVADAATSTGYNLYYLIIVFCVMFLLGSTLVCIGPFQSGFATIYRNLARGQGVSVFSDFKDGLKKNWKMSLKNMFISLILTAVILFGIGFYANHFGKFGSGASIFFIVIFCMFVVVQNIVNHMIVSLDLPLGKIYKNSILFMFIKLLSYAILLAILVVLLLILPLALLFVANGIGYAIAVIYYLLIAFSLPQYAFAFFTNDMINLYIVPKTLPVANNEETVKAETDISEEVDADDEVLEDEDSEDDVSDEEENNEEDSSDEDGITE